MGAENKFNWTWLGDVTVGRANLGPEMPVSVYRLMQYTIIEELENSFGADEARRIVRCAGFRAGTALAFNLLDLSVDFNKFVAQLQKILKDLKIGILKIEHMNLDALDFILTVDEDLDCSGLPVQGNTVCFYDEGFIAGILEAYTKKKFIVREIDCWATGDRTCRFSARQE